MTLALGFATAGLTGYIHGWYAHEARHSRFTALSRSNRADRHHAGNG